ncbi:MAG: type III-B CRISPR-associated protein Cas10/Cmr2, partial [Pseudomonadota bacterium]
MNTNGFRKDADYWDRKLSCYLHDPPDKALRVPGHEERARILADALGGVPYPDKNVYSRADRIASGMDRTLLPGYSANQNENGAVDFAAMPFLTHPTGKEPALNVTLRESIPTGGLTDPISEIIRKDMGERTDGVGLSERFSGRPEIFAAARFHYYHHVFRKRLAEENVGGLGGLWHRIPADTRIPDHSVWQHSALVSALSSCFELSKDSHASILVFGITPVQDFLTRARKLRDLWTGSLILSWLAFEGIRQVIYDLGSDHILYPSLINQPLVEGLLADELKLHWLKDSATSSGVASLPNKFVCLVPAGGEEEAARRVEAAVRRAWADTGKSVLDFLPRQTGQDMYLRSQFESQLAEFWSFHWAACPLLDLAAESGFKRLLHESVWSNPLEFLKASTEVEPRSLSEGGLYAVTHAVSQAFLAAGKTRRVDERPEEEGIKCALHGELEALRYQWKDGEDRNPRPRNDPFWRTFKSAWKPQSDFKPSERLSSVALIKRILYRVCKEDPLHPLHSFFAKAERFPSTTEMALHDWLESAAGKIMAHANTRDLGDWHRVRKLVSQWVHEREPDEAKGDTGPEHADMKDEEASALRRVLKDVTA